MSVSLRTSLEENESEISSGGQRVGVGRAQAGSPKVEGASESLHRAVKLP